MSPYGCALAGRQPENLKSPYGRKGAERTFRGTGVTNGPTITWAYFVAPASSPNSRSLEGALGMGTRSARLWRPAAPEIPSGDFAIAFRCPGPDAYFGRRFAPRLSVPMRMTPPAPRCRKRRSCASALLSSTGRNGEKLVTICRRDNRQYVDQYKLNNLCGENYRHFCRFTVRK